MIRGHKDGEHGVVHKEPELRVVRMEFNYAAVKFIPMPGGRCRISVIGSVDPKLAVVPSWLINWVATKVCWVAAKVLESKAKSVAKDEDCTHRKKMREDPELYSWVSERVEDWLSRNDTERTES
mmetsp:Transcript_39948/g.62324  ORF Transcript_39948/g.62324 Transcript_39948/m.62324 type:complete len:124 (+) Transcript_39948:552-923(+)